MRSPKSTCSSHIQVPPHSPKVRPSAHARRPQAGGQAAVAPRKTEPRKPGPGSFKRNPIELSVMTGRGSQKCPQTPTPRLAVLLKQQKQILPRETTVNNEGKARSRPGDGVSHLVTRDANLTKPPRSRMSVARCKIL